MYINNSTWIGLGKEGVLKIIGAFFFLALLMVAGAAMAIIPVNILAALFALPVVMVATIAFPLVSVVLAVFVTFGAIPSGFLPQVPLAGGTVRASELFLAGIGVVFLMHVFATKGQFVKSIRSSYTPVFIFLFILVIVSSVLAVGYFRTPLKYYLYELRVCLYWFTFPLLLYAIRDERGLRRLLVSLVLVGVIIAIGVVVQFLTGRVFLEAGKVESLNMFGSSYSDVRRSFAGGGIYFILFGLNLVICLWAYKKQNIFLSFLLALLMVFAVIVTFGRGVWAAEAVAFLMILFLVATLPRVKLVVSSVITLVVLLSTLYIFSPSVLEAVVDRATSVGREIESGESYDWRRTENSYAYSKIASNPAIGVALGGVYQPHRNRFMSPEQVRMIHNGYLYLVLKFGVLGLVVPILFAVVSIKKFVLMRRRGFKNDYAEPVLIAVMGTLLVPYLTSFTQPEWMYHTGVAFFSCAFVCIVLIERYWVNDEGSGGVLTK